MFTVNNTTSATNAQELAKEIGDFLKQGNKLVTLATDHCWWCKRFALAEEGYTLHDSIGYDTIITQSEIIQALKDENCVFVIPPDQSSFGYVFEITNMPEKWKKFVR